MPHRETRRPSGCEPTRPGRRTPAAPSSREAGPLVDLDYAALGFKCGLEIHQQVAGTKLFCRCPGEAPRELDDERSDFRFVRRLRPTQSEMGEVDAAALAEARRNRLFEYRGFHRWSCLVEADEEPPHEASPDALEAALMMSLTFGSVPVDEIEWMRKIVIDGSNTTGFQRTGLVARGGRVEDVGVQSICLEEDSCRRVGEEDGRVVWALDRLGVPLIEIATDAFIRDGAHAKRIAGRIGALLRHSGRVRRGLGTIRQDLNVSISGAPRVEVKGVQDLASIPHVIEWEVSRQRRLLEVAKGLKARHVDAASLTWHPHVLTDVFARSEAGFIRKSLDQGGIVLGHRLKGFHGWLGATTKEEPRLGRELAGYAKKDGGVQGILHGDELPGLGVADAEVGAARTRLGCGVDDSFVLVVEKAAVAERALRVVMGRAARALDGVLPEVRNAEADRTTSYLRPMPGAARMYPETDVPPNAVTPEALDRLRAALPPPQEQVVATLRAAHGLGAEEATQLANEGWLAEFEGLAAAGGASLASRTLLAYLPDLERRFPKTADAHLAWAKSVLDAVRTGRFAKEGVPNVLEALASGRAATVEEAQRVAGLAGVDLAQVEQRARALVQERLDFVKQRKAASVQPLMGALMKEYRGKVDGGRLNQILLSEIERVLRD